MRLSSLICCSLLMALAAQSGIAMPDAPLVKDTVASTALKQSALKVGRCVAADLDRKALGGTLLVGSSAVELPAGRYRLHVLLALSQLGDPYTRAFAITIAGGNTKHILNADYFSRSEEFTEQTLDVDLPVAGMLSYVIKWEFSGSLAEKSRLHALTVPELIAPDESDIQDAWGNAKPLSFDENGAIPFTDLPKIKYHLAACGVHIEPLSPFVIKAIMIDKILYAPNQNAIVTATIHNYAAEPINADIRFTEITGLADHRVLGVKPVEVPAGGETTV
ncbi:MAG: hypothetical protein ACYDBB_08930, partial [Armatimonadota bacterium]